MIRLPSIFISLWPANGKLALIFRSLPRHTAPSRCIIFSQLLYKFLKPGTLARDDRVKSEPGILDTVSALLTLLPITNSTLLPIISKRANDTGEISYPGRQDTESGLDH